MTDMTMNGLDLGEKESLLVSRHAPSGIWYASVGDLDDDDQREMATGPTAMDAFAELMLLLGGRVEGAH